MMEALSKIAQQGFARLAHEEVGFWASLDRLILSIPGTLMIDQASIFGANQKAMR